MRNGGKMATLAEQQAAANFQESVEMDSSSLWTKIAELEKRIVALEEQAKRFNIKEE